MAAVKAGSVDVVYHPNWCIQQRKMEITQNIWTGRTIFTEGNGETPPPKTGGGILRDLNREKNVAIKPSRTASSPQGGGELSDSN
eukprot:4187836-Lingulodinium_polyedra.AAC.1